MGDGGNSITQLTGCMFGQSVEPAAARNVTNANICGGQQCVQWQRGSLV